MFSRNSGEECPTDCVEECVAVIPESDVTPSVNRPHIPPINVWVCVKNMPATLTVIVLNPLITNKF